MINLIRKYSIPILSFLGLFILVGAIYTTSTALYLTAGLWWGTLYVLWLVSKKKKQMPTENEILIGTREDNTITEEDGVYTILYSPEVCLFRPSPMAFIIPGQSFDLFRSKEDLEMLEKIKVGDQVNMVIDFSDPLCDAVYKAWNPPIEFQVEEGIYPMTVKEVFTDKFGKPVIVGAKVEEENEE